MSSHISPLPALLVLLLGALPGQAAPIDPHVASIPASVSIGSVKLPDKKDGARVLSHAVGKDVEGVVREEVAVALVALRAFTEVLPEGGQYVLDLDIGAVRRENPDPAAPDDRMPLAVSLEGGWTWSDASGVLRSGEAKIRSERILGEPAQRADLELVMRKALDELGERAFADFYGSRK